jgi:hypothetical protein
MHSDPSLTVAASAVPASSTVPAGLGPDGTATAGMRRWLKRWSPGAAGLALGVVGLTDIQPWTPAETTTWLLPVLALAYLALGAARGQLHDARVLAVQLAGLATFSLVALVAIVVDPQAGHYVVAAGWFGHAIWDVAHHRDLNDHAGTAVVPRGYAEVCFVLDLLVGASLVVAPVA